MKSIEKSNSIEIEYGTRIISDRNSSKIIAIPKRALQNLSNTKFRKLSIKLVFENGEKFIKMIPVYELERRYYD